MKVAGFIPLVAAAVALLLPGLAFPQVPSAQRPPDQLQPGQLRPHRAEYTLRLGTALNATRIGTVVQDIVLTCDGWRIRRELGIDASLTPSFKVSFTSRLEGDELRGKGFAWRALQAVNGTEREVKGKVERKDGAWQVDRTTPDGPQQSPLPSLTLMPVAAVDWLLRRLAGGSESFPLLLFVPEADGGAFLLDVKRAAAGAADVTPPSQRRVEVPGTRSWPFALAVTRPGAGNGKPLVTLRGRLFDSGVIDGLVADAGVVTVAAHLRDLQMHEAPACPASN
jgi:EipB-like